MEVNYSRVLSWYKIFHQSRNREVAKYHLNRFDLTFTLAALNAVFIPLSVRRTVLCRGESAEHLLYHRRRKVLCHY